MKDSNQLHKTLAGQKGRAAGNARTFLYEADHFGLLVSLVVISLDEVTFELTIGDRDYLVSFYGDGEITGSTLGMEDFELHTAAKCLETIRGL